MSADLSSVVWSCEGRLLEAVDWLCNTSLGGHDSARVSVPLDTVTDLSQGNLLRGMLAGAVIWEGVLLSDPTVAGSGYADLDGVGHRHRMEDRSGRLLYQTQDYGLWSDAAFEPYNRTGHDDRVQFFNKGNHLYFEIPGGTTSPGFRQACIWVPNTPGGLTRYAFRLQGSPGSTAPGWQISIVARQFTGPSGTLSTINTHSVSATLGNPRDFDQNIAGAPDGLLFQAELAFGHDATNGNSTLARVSDLRVNGIAVGDSMSGAQIITDIGNRCGFDTGYISAAGIQALPFDVQAGESWDNVVAYLAILEGSRAVLVLDGDKPHMVLRSFHERGYDVRLASGTEPLLRPLRRYSHLRVVWSAPAGGVYDLITEIPGHGLPTRTQSMYTITIADPQPSDSLAQQVTAATMRDLSRPRFQGTLRVSAAHGASREPVDPYLIEPGSFVRLSDMEPVPRELRVFDVAKDPRGVTLGIEDLVAADDYMTRLAFEANRPRHLYLTNKPDAFFREQLASRGLRGG